MAKPGDPIIMTRPNECRAPNCPCVTKAHMAFGTCAQETESSRPPGPNENDRVLGRSADSQAKGEAPQEAVCSPDYQPTLPRPPIPHPPAPLEEKLAWFDRYAVDAVFDLIDLLFRDKERLVALARERHIWGHHAYGDKNLREWDDARLRVERDQEVADWLVYRCDEYRRGSTG